MLLHIYLLKQEGCLENALVVIRNVVEFLGNSQHPPPATAQLQVKLLAGLAACRMHRVILNIQYTIAVRRPEGTLPLYGRLKALKGFTG